MDFTRIHIVALGVKNIQQSSCFYQKVLNLPPNKNHENQEYVFFKMPGTLLEIYKKPHHEQTLQEPSLYGITLTHTVKDKESIDYILQKAERAGGQILKPFTKTAWGGFHGYFCDLDNYCWAITYFSQWNYDEDGSLLL
jgi:catechol 2,3-dioxygenase-like lactoylglutathione lyase family enzyme